MTVNWRFFSLEEVNRVEGKKHPWEREWSYGWSLMRIGALLRRQGMGKLDELVRGRPGGNCTPKAASRTTASVARQIIARLGHDPGLVDAAIADPSTGDEVLAEHRQVIEAGGFGVPTLFFPDGQCLFGPVLIDPPRGEAAVQASGRRWWRGLGSRTCMSCSGRRAGPISRSITTTFQPYLRGRDWVSVNRGNVVNFGRRPMSASASAGPGPRAGNGAAVS